jgi:hypothetical protein
MEAGNREDSSVNIYRALALIRCLWPKAAILIWFFCRPSMSRMDKRYYLARVGPNSRYRPKLAI